MASKRRKTVRARSASSRARSRASVKGWQTRRRHAAERSARVRKAWRTRRREAKRTPAPKSSSRRRAPKPKPSGRRERIDHLITFSFSAKGRSYRRDLVVPAARGTSMRDLIRQAREQLPPGASSLARFLTPATAEILEGPPTRRRRTELR